jgi:hypothetical protein
MATTFQQKPTCVILAVGMKPILNTLKIKKKKYKKLLVAITSLNLIQNLQIIREHLFIYNPSELFHVQKTQRFVSEAKQGPSLDVRAIARWKANDYIQNDFSNLVE